MKPIYLEPDEEITSVIDKISQLSDRQVALVAPKNSGLFQSLINLKLLAKEAKKQDKELAIIGANKTGVRLAEQVGLRSYATLGALGEGPKKPAFKAEAEAVVAAETLPDGIKINRYQPPKTGDGLAEEPMSAESEEAAAPVVEVKTAAEVPAEPVETEAPTKPSDDQSETVPSELLPHPPPSPAEPVELPAIVSRGYSTRTEFTIPWRSMIIAGGLLVIIFLLLMIFLPRATVTASFPATEIKKTVNLTATTANSDTDLSLPASLLVSEQSATQTITATGKKDIGAKATGSVAIKNCEDTSSHSLPAGSKLSSGGKNFTTNAAVTIPAGQFSNGGQTCSSSTVSAAITAEAAGDSYNFSNASFTIAGLSSRFSATGTTTGGSTKQVTVLTQEDVDKALAALKQEVTDKGVSEIKTKAAAQTLLDGASWITVKSQAVDKKVGDQVDSATATYAVEVSALVFDENSAQEKIKTNASQDIPAGQELVIPDDKKPQLVVKTLAEDKTNLTLEAAVNGFAVEKVDKAGIARAIARKSVSGAKTILADQFRATSSEITVTPSWWFGRLPLLHQEITVEYGFDKQPAN